eukprot:CAMPEP_0172569156 /NCGR_PEP_ID=MMETSP1067-20121228/122429_1 /TAXON_ID=265564 ORGANISM="Thalassiosira punctigera, Strain Tpunct2005C2" /NCGR_SAMPLE_ID=MMETSP1067 /ASSEMBLY_ACC=CAM_ASM_000444 /LENGTH=527 /DNA_ID=CAMNT_0013360929 /DNA_START=396 /DNA_END=1975 /DNA_ORIENTATION=-
MILQREEVDELPDFDDDDADKKRLREEELISIPLPKANPIDDLTGATLREFSFGPDVLLSAYAGSLGFDKVTDWQYFATDPYSGERKEVSPMPMNPNQPSRTRSSSGSVVRLFIGELGGKLASKMRSRGVDARVLIKEFSGDEAINLARAEKKGLGRVQSAWLKNNLKKNNKHEMVEVMEEGEWMEEAKRRYVDGLTDTPTPKDDENLITLLELLSSQKSSFSALLGEMNLMDYFDDETTDPNEWYKSLGVKPPQPGSVWLVYDYHGLNTAASYAVPSLIRRSKMPPRRGPFGGIMEAPPLPPFKERARYMVQGTLKGMMSAVADAHEAGIVHRSIGRNSFIMSSVGQDKREATSPYAVVTARLRVILSDWGFSATLEEATREKEFGVRSRMFGIPALGSYEDQVADDDRIHVAVGEFAMAEDLNAVGLTFLTMLFTTLAEPATLTAPMPPTDDDSWQRLFSEIFSKDIDQFREYCSNEDIWDSVVELLDREDGAGWDLLEDLLLARERVSSRFKGEEVEGTELVSA